MVGKKEDEWWEKRRMNGGKKANDWWENGG